MRQYFLNNNKTGVFVGIAKDVTMWLGRCVAKMFFAKCSRLTFLADRTNGRAYATVLRLSVVCDVMYCG